MATNAEKYVWDYPGLTIYEKGVMLLCVGFLDSEHGCLFMKQENLAKKLSCSRSTVIRTIESLRKKGLIQTFQGDYTLCVHPSDEYKHAYNRADDARKKAQQGLSVVDL